MGWWNKKDEELPEELRNMKPEELLAAVKASERVAALEGELAKRPTQEALDLVQSEFEDTKQRLQALEEGRGNDNPQPDPNRRPAQPTSFLVDGDRAFMERAQPLVSGMLSIGAQTARSEARRRLEVAQRTKTGNIDAYLWDKFEGEVDMLSRNVAAAHLVQPETWLNIFHTVKGRHADEIAQHRAEGKGEYFVEPAGAGGGKPPAVEPEEKPLNEAEKKVAKNMGMTEAEYQKYKKEQRVYA